MFANFCHLIGSAEGKGFLSTVAGEKSVAEKSSQGSAPPPLTEDQKKQVYMHILHIYTKHTYIINMPLRTEDQKTQAYIQMYMYT